MSLLEELRQQARETMSSESIARAEARDRRGLAHEKLHPKLDSLYRYFDELTEHLNVIDEPVKRTFSLADAGGGVLQDLRQHAYHCATTEPDVVDRFTFQFVCAAPGRFEQRIDHPSRARAAADALRRHGLRFKMRELPGGGSSFVIEKRVPVMLEFSMDVDREVVHLRTRNLGELGVTTLRLAPGAIDPELMEELAKWVLARPERVRELIGYTIAPERRKALQREMKRQQGRRAAELKGPLARAWWVMRDWIERKLERD